MRPNLISFFENSSFIAGISDSDRGVELASGGKGGVAGGGAGAAATVGGGAVTSGAAEELGGPPIGDKPIRGEHKKLN